tara:strand:- start:56 stop:358 length:303 start_codon:yes stop_codon:yes gene_type:complete
MANKLAGLMDTYAPVIIQGAVAVAIVGVVYKTFVKGNTLYGEGKDAKGKKKNVKIARKTDLGYQLYNPKLKKYEGTVYSTQEEARKAWNNRFGNGFKEKK